MPVVKTVLKVSGIFPFKHDDRGTESAKADATMIGEGQFAQARNFSLTYKGQRVELAE